MLLLYHRDFSEVIKIWVDAGEIKTYDLDYNDRKFAKIMQEVPNFDKSEGAKKIYQKREYIILKMKKGFIVYNTKKVFSEGHSHLNSFNMAKVVIDNCIKKRKPRTDSLYVLDSHVRVSNDDKYKMFIEEIITAKKGNKKLKYRNVNSKKIR